MSASSIASTNPINVSTLSPEKYLYHLENGNFQTTISMAKPYQNKTETKILKIERLPDRSLRRPEPDGYWTAEPKEQGIEFKQQWEISPSIYSGQKAKIVHLGDEGNFVFVFPNGSNITDKAYKLTLEGGDEIWTLVEDYLERDPQNPFHQQIGHPVFSKSKLIFYNHNQAEAARVPKLYNYFEDWMNAVKEFQKIEAKK